MHKSQEEKCYIVIQCKKVNSGKPKKRYLLIFNLGDGSGLLVWGSWIWKGRLTFFLKNYLDRSFMTKFQASRETT